MLAAGRRFLNKPQTRGFLYRTSDDVFAAGDVKVMPSGACESRRYFLHDSGLGFSFHETYVYPNRHMFIHYKHHLEAVFVTQGTGLISLVPTQEIPMEYGKKYELYRGAAYALNNHEAHWLAAGNHGMTVVCAFNPPCFGDEKQGPDGSFPYRGKVLLPDE